MPTLPQTGLLANCTAANSVPSSESRVIQEQSGKCSDIRRQHGQLNAGLFRSKIWLSFGGGLATSPARVPSTNYSAWP